MTKLYCPTCKEYFIGEATPPYSAAEKKVGNIWVHVHPVTNVELTAVPAKDDSATVVAIDPVGCNCDNCFNGVHVPLSHATDELINLLLNGELRDRTNANFTVHMSADPTAGGKLGAEGYSFAVESFAFPLGVKRYSAVLSSESLNQLFL